MRILICALVVALAACQPATTATASAARDNLGISARKPVAQGATTVPTANPLPSRTPTTPLTSTPVPTDTPMPSNTPSPTLLLLVFRTNTPPGGIAPTTPPTSLPTLPSINSPTPGSGVDENGTPIPTWTPPPPDPSVQIADHYRLLRPISENNVNYLDRTYPYGGTAGNSLQVHHGVDFANPSNTPILAAADGVVYYAGDDLSTVFGLTTNYYGNLVVIQHNFASPEGQPVFTLYGHMQSIDVQTGQAVHAGDVIGKVGATGVAFGAHLHLEVRVGDPNSFGATRNPDLWIYPYRRYGTLAGRVTDASGNILYQATVQIRSATRTRYAFTYADNSVNGDDTFHENFTYGDLPANYYEVSVNDGQRVRFRKMIYVYPDRTTWIDIQLN